MSRDKREYAFHRRFWQLVFNEHVDTHIRMPNVPGVWCEVIGTAADLHGPDGVCTCCPRAAEKPGDAA